MTTAPFIKPDIPRPATSAWLVHQVGDGVEIVHVGRTTPDTAAVLERIAAAFGGAVPIAGDDPDTTVGVFIAGVEADPAWRLLVTGALTDNSKVDNTRILLGFNRSQYVALARRAGIQ